MKLYFSPGACSLSPRIALLEARLPFESEQVSLDSKQTKSGIDFTTINPKGQVPTLLLEDGQILTEGPAIVQYIADKKPESKLAPPAGSLARYQLQEWLNFISTELHKNFSTLFNNKAPDDWKAVVRENISSRFDYIAKVFDTGRPYLTGEIFTVADGYLFTVLRWAKGHRLDLTKWPSLKSYFDRIDARPAVQAALQAEGIKK